MLNGVNEHKEMRILLYKQYCIIMVKNTIGGNKQKGMARKNTTSTNKQIRLSTSVAERYARVTRMYGGKLCEVITDNNLNLKCAIRGKFSGKYKRSNTIAPGSIILVGLREWESEATICDLMEVYDPTDVQIIRSLPNINLKFDDSTTSEQGDDLFADSSVGQQFIPDEDDIVEKVDTANYVDDDIDFSMI